MITVHTAPSKTSARQVSIDGKPTNFTAKKEGKFWVIRENGLEIDVVSKFREVEFVIAEYVQDAPLTSI